MVKKTIECNGVTVRFDWMDSVFQKKFSSNLNALGEKFSALNVDNLTEEEETEVQETQFDLCANLIDSVFGEGTSGKMFGDRKPLDEIFEFIYACINLKFEQIDSFNAMANNMSDFLAKLS